MVTLKNTEENVKQNNVHCPHCSKKWFSAMEVVDLNFKCFNCHRRYLINLDEKSLSVKLVSFSKDELE